MPLSTLASGLHDLGRATDLRRALTSSALTMAIGLSLVAAETVAKRGRFLTPKELAELGDKSEVQYATRIVESGTDLPGFRHPGFPKDGPLQGTPYPDIVEASDGSRSLFSYRLSAIAIKALEEAEPLFQARQYADALVIYRDASLRDPKCYVLYLSIGDSYLFSGNALAALESYEKAIELNPHDFHGYWFRGSALLELGKVDEARRAYARAVAMAPRNAALLAAINSRATRLGIRPIAEIFHPLAVARPEGDGFAIYAVEGLHWWIYGLCKAVWQAEEGHRKDLTGRPEHRWTTTEELECTGNLLASYRTGREEEKVPAEAELDLLLRVLDSGDIGGFVNYEFGSQLSPDYALLLDRDSQAKVLRFVERYVFQSL